MCMICKGLQRSKFSVEEAREKLEELVDLDLINEDHQEVVENLIAEYEEEEYCWATAKKNTRKYEDMDEEDSVVDEDDYGSDSYDEEEYDDN